VTRYPRLRERVDEFLGEVFPGGRRVLEAGPDPVPPRPRRGTPFTPDRISPQLQQFGLPDVLDRDRLPRIAQALVTVLAAAPRGALLAAAEGLLAVGEAQMQQWLAPVRVFVHGEATRIPAGWHALQELDAALDKLHESIARRGASMDQAARGHRLSPGAPGWTEHGREPVRPGFPLPPVLANLLETASSGPDPDSTSARRYGPGRRETARSSSAMLSAAQLDVAPPGRGSMASMSPVLSHVARFGQNPVPPL